MAEHHPLRTPDQLPKTAAYAQLNLDAERRAKQCRSAAMPSLEHLKMADYQTVYEPSDDTYLLIDAIGMDMDQMEGEAASSDQDKGVSDAVDGDGGGGDGSSIMKRSNSIETTLEIGCGTGVPGVYLNMRLRDMIGDRDNKNNNNNNNDDNDANDKHSSSNTPDKNNNTIIHHATDINSDAIRIAKLTAHHNGIPPDQFLTHRCDLASSLLPRLQNSIDVLIFNPPYVPTPDDEVGSSGIEASWAGGADGRVVADRAWGQIARLLRYPSGAAYVVAVDDNYPEEICGLMGERFGVRCVPWARRRARNEYLTVLKMTPTRVFREGDGDGDE